MPAKNEPLGARVRALRKAKGLTVEQVSAAAHAAGHPISASYISQIEQGRRGTSISADFGRRLALGLGLTPRQTAGFLAAYASPQARRQAADESAQLAIQLAEEMSGRLERLEAMVASLAELVRGQQPPDD